MGTAPGSGEDEPLDPSAPFGIRKFKHLRSDEDRDEVLATLLRVAAEDAGAWATLTLLAGTLRARLSGEDPPHGAAEPPLPSETQRESDWKARRIASMVLAGVETVPTSSEAFVEFAKDLSHIDDSRSVGAMARAERLHRFIDAILHCARAHLPSRQPEDRWECLAVPSGSARRAAIAEELLATARDPSKRIAYRCDAIVTAAALGILEQHVRGDRHGEVWGALDCMSTEARVEDLTKAVAARMLAASGLRCAMARHFETAAYGEGRLDEGIRDVILDRAARAVGCLPGDAADLDPLRRWARRLLVGMFGQPDDPRSVIEHLESLSMLAGDLADQEPTAEERHRRRHLWSVIALAVQKNTPSERSLDMAGSALAVLTAWELRERRAVASDQVGARWDVHGLTAFSVLRQALAARGPSASVLDLMQDVADLRLTDDAEIARRLDTAMPSRSVDAGVPGGPVTQPKAPGLRVPSLLAVEAYQIWHGGNLTTRQVAERLNEAHGRRIGHGSVSKWVRSVEAFVEAGGVLPQADATPAGLPSRMQTLSPDNLERGSPKTAERHREDPNDAPGDSD